MLRAISGTRSEWRQIVNSSTTLQVRTPRFWQAEITESRPTDDSDRCGWDKEAGRGKRRGGSERGAGTGSRRPFEPYTTPELADGAHRVEHARHDLGGTPAARRVCGTNLEQLRVGQNHAELVAEPVIQRSELRGLADRLAQCGGDGGPVHAASRELSSASAWSGRAGASGARHKLSSKMRTAPPAVRTYSTLPAAIQL